MTIDWEQYRLGNSITCTFKPRSTWNGASVREGIQALVGKQMQLTVCWKMDNDDKYPGEYALEGADEETRVMLETIPITWVASGDVVPIPSKE